MARVFAALAVVSAAACTSYGAGVQPVAVGRPAAAPCGSTSPAEYYWRTERPAQPLPYVEHVDLDADYFRRLHPRETRRRYSTASLKCWARVGDPLADYLLALNRLDQDDLEGLWDRDVKRRLRGAIAPLRRASQPRVCSEGLDAEASAFYGCGLGLAEAHYALAHAYHRGLGLRRSLADAEVLYRKSAEQGYAPANMALKAVRRPSQQRGR